MLSELTLRAAGMKLLLSSVLLVAALSYSDSAVLAQSSNAEVSAADASSSSVAAEQQEGGLTDAESFMAEGKRFLANGLYLEAADIFETVLTEKEASHLWPEAAMLTGKAYLFAARVIESEKLRGDAIEKFKSFERSFGRSAFMEEVSFLWGLALFESGDYFEAEPRFAALLKRFPKSSFAPESVYHLGLILEKAQKYLEAQKKYYRVIEYYRRPANRVEDSTFRIARISELLEKHDLAVKWYLLACKRNRQRCLMDSDVLFYRGKAYSALGEHRRAVEQLQRFANIFPADTRYDEAMLALAASLTALDDLNGAAAILGMASESKKQESRAEALLRLASLEQETGKKLTDDGFVSLYERIVAESPFTEQAMIASMRISKHYLKRGNLRGSLEYVDRFFATYGENRFTNEMFDVRDDVILGLLQSYLDEEEYFDAAMMFEERESQIKRRSSLSRARFLAGQIHFGLMGYGRSASLLRATEDKYLSPDDRRRIRLLLAIQSYFEGAHEKAASELENLTFGKADETSFTARCHLIDLLLRQGKNVEALKHYRELATDYSETRFLLSLDFRAGLALSAQKQYSLARAAFDRFIQFNLRRRKLQRAMVSDPDATGSSDGSQPELRPLDCESYLVVGALLEKAKCCTALGQRDEAVTILEEVMQGCEKSPLLFQVCCLLADLRLQQGRPDDATKILKKCEELEIDDEVFKESQSLLLGEIEVKKRLDEISDWWVEE